MNLRRGLRASVVSMATAFLAATAGAHAGLSMSDPTDGSTLGDTPAGVRLTFTEPPDPTLSRVQIVDLHGIAYGIGAAEAVTGDAMSVALRVKPLDTGIYTVNWRLVSAIDGHVTAGRIVFGIRTDPGSYSADAAPADAAVSKFEMAARGLQITGLAALFGVAISVLARFGGVGARRLAAAGWGLSALGLCLLVGAELQGSGVSLAVLRHTKFGVLLAWQAAALAAAGLLLLAAWRFKPRLQREAMALIAATTLSAIAVHVMTGHAGADRAARSLGVVAQVLHFAAAGVWVGGLVALLLAIRGAASPEKAARVRRFSRVAGGCLFVVLATGLFRAAIEVASWEPLVRTGYGRTVLVKGVLMLIVCVLAAVNHWWSMPAAAGNLRRLRTVAGVELAGMASLLLAASVLGALAPPASEARSTAPGLRVSGADFATSAKVQLSLASDQPGPNRFAVRVDDYDAGKRMAVGGVSLRFTPLDDPDAPSTALALNQEADGSYIGSGPNISFDGRWRVDVVVERAEGSVRIPLIAFIRAEPAMISVQADPGRAPAYTVYLKRGEFVRFSPDPLRVGASQIDLRFFDKFGDEQDIEQIVATHAAAPSLAQQRPVSRLGPGRFKIDVNLGPGQNSIAAIAKTVDGARLRAQVELKVPAGS